MTFKELSFRDELGIQTEEQSIMKTLMGGQSPIMKVWFFIMVLNLVMFLFIVH